MERLRRPCPPRRRWRRPNPNEHGMRRTVTALPAYVRAAIAAAWLWVATAKDVADLIAPAISQSRRLSISNATRPHDK